MLNCKCWLCSFKYANEETKVFFLVTFVILLYTAVPYTLTSELQQQKYRRTQLYLNSEHERIKDSKISSGLVWYGTMMGNGDDNHEQISIIYM